MLHLEKQEPKPKSSTQEELIKIRAGINKMEKKRIYRSKRWFFGEEKKTKIDKPLAKLNKGKRK